MSDYQSTMRDLRDHTAPDPAAVAALRAGLQRGPDRRRPVAVAVAGLALAATLLFALRPAPAVDQELAGVLQTELGGHVQVAGEGDGSVVGTAAAMDIRWQRGRLEVEVEPEQGIQLAVTTEEGSARVVGTGFTVIRDALGTTVEVRHGRVAVDCGRGGESLLEAGARRTCLPVTAPAALRRVLSLQADGDHRAALAELDALPSLPGAQEALVAEAAGLRAGTLVALGRNAEALAAAEAAITTPGCTREEELRRMAARLSLDADDCAGAERHLLALRTAGAVEDPELDTSACTQR